MERHENVVPKVTKAVIYLGNMARHGISDFAERNPKEKDYLDKKRYRRDLATKICVVAAEISAKNDGKDNVLGQLDIAEAINTLRLLEGGISQAIEGLTEKDPNISTRIENVGGSSKLIEATAREICEELDKKIEITPAEYYEEKVKKSLASLESRKSRDGNRQ